MLSSTKKRSGIVDRGILQAAFARIAHLAGEGRHRRHLGADQIHLCVLGAAAALEVAVAGAQRHGPALRTQAVAYAEAADRLQQPGSGGQKLGDIPVLGGHLQHLARAGCHPAS